MKLFVFKVSDYWTYCGGMAVVTATDYDSACAALQAKENEANKQFDFAQNTMKFRRTEFEADPKGVEAVDTWVLKAELELAENQHNVCEIDFNYS